MSARLVCLGIGMMIGAQVATQLTAWTYAWAPPLGAGLRIDDNLTLYPPWSVLSWAIRFDEEAGEVIRRYAVLVVIGAAAGFGCGGGWGRPALRRRRGWGGWREARRAGLDSREGVILGRLGGRTLASMDMRPTLVTGGTRTGKGRGHVTPTLLSWPESVMIHDPKRELWAATAGWRSRFSHTLYLDPRDLASARWNPLAAIHPGPGELAQVQRLVAILADPSGSKDEDTIWDKAACELLEAVVLHVLYAAPDEDKTLVKVRDLLADVDGTVELMSRTLHRRGAAGEPEVHPFIRNAAASFAVMHERFRTSVQGTARAYLKWLAGEDVERVLSGSDFSMGDLMSASAPVSLYVQFAPADAAALRPLVRLIFYAAAQALTADVDCDQAGRPKRRKLLMLMDEFPLLGRLSFFEKGLRLLSGYGVKAMFICQSLNDIVETYGANNTILDNCAVYTAFSALDPLTQEKISRLSGVVKETRRSRSGPAWHSTGRATVSASEIERPLLDPGDVRALPDDLQVTFAAGRLPLLTRKLKYDRTEPFRSRARHPAPDQREGVDAPSRALHPWAGRSSLGERPASDGLAVGRSGVETAAEAIAARAAEVASRVAQDLAAEHATLNHLQGSRHG